MNKDQLYEAIGDINEEYICDAHKSVKKAPFAWLHWVAMAACLCLLLTAAIAAPRLFVRPNDPEQPTNIHQTTDTGSSQLPPEYVPSYSSPDLESLYKEAPFDALIPRALPETFSFGSSYKSEYDPIANPNSDPYLWLDFTAKDSASNIEIRISKYDGRESVAVPEKTETYDLSRLYDYLKTPGAVQADGPDVLEALFRSEDLSVSVTEKRMYVFDDGLCKAEIKILCGNYTIAYHYAGTEITPTAFYEMITSADYFQGILDGGADIAVDAESDKAPGASDEILKGILDGGANIAIDSAP